MEVIEYEKNGISLIVLIITIVVLILLSVPVILIVNKNNPLKAANEAKIKSDISNYVEELNNRISESYINLNGKRTEKINATKYTKDKSASSVYTYISSFISRYEGKFVIKRDELMYVKEKLSEKEIKWCEDINIPENEKMQSNWLQVIPKNI